MSLTIKLNNQRLNNPVIKLEGRLDGATSAEFEQAFEDLVVDQPNGTCVTLDLADLDYISSMGLRLILTIRKKIEKSGGNILMANLQPPVQHVMDIANVLPSWSLFASVEEADAYFDNMQRQAKDNT